MLQSTAAMYQNGLTLDPSIRVAASCTLRLLYLAG